jgi:hypothetical protein
MKVGGFGEEVSAIMFASDMGPIEANILVFIMFFEYGLWGDHVKWVVCSFGGIDCFWRILCCRNLDLEE